LKPWERVTAGLAFSILFGAGLLALFL